MPNELPIERVTCIECPHYEYYRFHMVCLKAQGKVVEGDTETVPEWCPLRANATEGDDGK